MAKAKTKKAAAHTAAKTPKKTKQTEKTTAPAAAPAVVQPALQFQPAPGTIDKFLQTDATMTQAEKKLIEKELQSDSTVISPAASEAIKAAVAAHDEEKEEEEDSFQPSQLVRIAGETPNLKPATVGLHAIAVRGNVKGGVATSLSPRTLLIGRNGAHKSSVVNTLELALRGVATDVAWKPESKDEANLMTLAPGRTGLLYAEVALSNGDRATYKASDEKGAKRAIQSAPPVVDPARVFPLRAVREALSGSADTARRFFLERIVDKLKPSDVLSRIPDDLHKHVKAAGFNVKDDASGPAVVAALLLARTTAKKSQTAATAAEKAHKLVMSEAAAGLPPEPTEAEIEQAVLDVKAATDALTATAQASTLGDAPKRLEEVMVEGTQIVQEMQTITAQLATMPAVTQLGPEYALAKDLLTWHVALGVDFCLNCGSGAAHGITPEVLRGRLAAFEAQVGTTIRQNAERTMAENSLRVLQNRHATLTTTYTSLAQQISTAGQAPAGLTVAQAQINLTAANERLSLLREIRAKHEARHKAGAALDGAHNNVATWKKVTAKLKELTKEFLDGAVVSFVNRVNKYLPPSDTFGMQLVDGEKEVFHVGLVVEPAEGADPILHVALSAVESVRLSLAIAAALCENYEGLAILIPEDRAFHPADLTLVMQALSQSTHQIVMAHPMGPTDINGRAVLPEGWTIIDCDRGEHIAHKADWGYVPAPTAAEATSAS